MRSAFAEDAAALRWQGLGDDDSRLGSTARQALVLADRDYFKGATKQVTSYDFYVQRQRAHRRCARRLKKNDFPPRRPDHRARLLRRLGLHRERRLLRPEAEDKAQAAWRRLQFHRQEVLRRQAAGKAGRLHLRPGRTATWTSSNCLKRSSTPPGYSTPNNYWKECKWKRRITAPRQVLAELQPTTPSAPSARSARACTCSSANARFWRNCPSGTRFRWEAYYASGKMELARGLHTQELEPNESMAHPLLLQPLLLLPGTVLRSQADPAHQGLRADARAGGARGLGPLPEHKARADSLEKNDNPWASPAISAATGPRAAAERPPPKRRCPALRRLHLRRRPQPGGAVSGHGLVEGGMDVGTLGSEELCCGAPCCWWATATSSRPSAWKTSALQGHWESSRSSPSAATAPGCSRRNTRSRSATSRCCRSPALWRLAKKKKNLAPQGKSR